MNSTLLHFSLLIVASLSVWTNEAATVTFPKIVEWSKKENFKGIVQFDRF